MRRGILLFFVMWLLALIVIGSKQLAAELGLSPAARIGLAVLFVAVGVALNRASAKAALQAMIHPVRAMNEVWNGKK